jgi:cobalt-zinc-cadmium resistance protein CzcA
MSHTLMEKSLKHRPVVLLIIIVLACFGFYHYQQLPVDAFPDISPVMVPVFAEAHGMAPEEVERFITFPIESAMNGLPGVTQIKSTSAFGMAVIYVYFKDDIDIYFARQIVAERLGNAIAGMPDLHEPPSLGPISTGLGEVFMYYLTLDPGTETQGKDPNTFLREINDWVVKYQLQAVPGVTEILSMGGHVLQYQVKINPYALNKYGITLEEVVESINENNRNAGGQFIVIGSEEYLVRGVGMFDGLEAMRNIHLKVAGGRPVLLRNVARVEYGREIRRGVVTVNGEQEVVTGIVMKLFKENTSEVIHNLKQQIPSLKASLPEGVNFIPFYDQVTLVEKATGTVKKALLQGAVLVLIVLLLFLGNLRSALIVALALPFCAAVAIVFMGISGLSANLMSLGGIAIAIGMLGDGSIVMVENIHRHLCDPANKDKKRFKIIRRAAEEVERPIIFSVAIIIIVFLPIFTLQGIEGKMFSPMAFSISFALIGALFAALFMSPVLSSYLLKLKSLYRFLLVKALARKKTVLGITVIAFIASLALIPVLGTEFIPILEEGTLLVGVVMPPSISLDEATKTVMKLEKMLLEFEEVESTVAKIGRPEAGGHPHPINSALIQTMLRPKSQWHRYRTKEELIQAIEKNLSRYPGIQLNFTQPIQHLFDDLLTGVRTQLALKLYGEDLDVLRKKAKEIQDAIETVPGLVDLSVEQNFGQPQVKIVADREACARYGVSVVQLLEIVELAIGGEVIDHIYVNNRRFGIHVRYQAPFREKLEAISSLLIRTAEGYAVPLSQIARVEKTEGPIQISREKNMRRWAILANVRGRDMGSVVADIKKRIKENIKMDPGYYLEYGGQFENQKRAMARLGIIVPLAICLIFFMLFLTFESIRYALLIIINVPLALIGGVFGLFIMKEYLSVPAAVGFIALFGIAVQNGVVLVSYISTHRQEGANLDDALLKGCLLRLRPVLMTALTTVLGLVPLLLSSGIGAEVQRPLAAVVVFGLISSTFLTLFIIPALYGWFEKKEIHT